MPTALGAVLTLRFANSRRLFLVKKLGKPETEDTTIDPGDPSMTCIVNPTGGSSGTNWLVSPKSMRLAPSSVRRNQRFSVTRPEPCSVFFYTKSRPRKAGFSSSVPPSPHVRRGAGGEKIPRSARNDFRADTEITFPCPYRHPCPACRLASLPWHPFSPGGP